DKDRLRQHPNVMALFVLAHLEAQRTHGDDQERAKAKLDLLVLLSARKLDEEDWRHWHRFLGWFLKLPPAIDDQVFAQFRSLTKEEKNMKPVGWLEEWQARGECKGLLAGLEVVLEVKYQQAGLDLMPEFRKITDHDRLGVLLQAVRKAASL